MAFQAQSNHYFGFYLGTLGKTTVDFTVDVFTIDDASVDTPTLSSFEVVEMGSGYYYASYLPTKAGRYFLGFHCSTQFFADCEDISAADFVVKLSQDTGGSNQLRPSLPMSKFLVGLQKPGDLSEYLLMVFQSDDWNVGRTQNTYAVAMTRLDASGNWLTTPLMLSPDTYHIIIRNNYGNTMVVAANLDLSGGF
jgi:hypothetical protein